LWNNSKKYEVINMVHAALLRVLWRVRNDLCFNHHVWPLMRVIWCRTAYMIAQCGILLRRQKEGTRTGWWRSWKS
jgi:hypothetical protein